MSEKGEFTMIPSNLGWANGLGGMVVTTILENTFYDKEVKTCSSKGTNLNLPLDHFR